MENKHNGGNEIGFVIFIFIIVSIVMLIGLIWENYQTEVHR